MPGSPEATVLIPTFDHGPTLLRSVRSVLAQTVEDIEVFIVGDGVPDVTREVVATLAREDGRVRFFDNPKGPSRGETHRHAALGEARGNAVCYLADDDLWLPRHVETMLNLLENADFANAPPVRFLEGEEIDTIAVDLALPVYREFILSGINRVPLSCGAHTLSAYRRLPHGWRTTPAGKPTDLHMWQQFLAEPGCRAASGFAPTALNFPSPQRSGWTAEERVAELDLWAGRIGDAAWLDGFVSEVLDSVAKARAHEWATPSGPGIERRLLFEQRRMVQRLRSSGGRNADLERALAREREKGGRLARELGDERRKSGRLGAELQEIRNSEIYRVLGTVARAAATVRGRFGGRG